MCKYLEQRPAWKEFDKEILFSFFQRKCFFLWQNNGYLFVFLGFFFHRLFFSIFQLLSFPVFLSFFPDFPSLSHLLPVFYLSHFTFLYFYLSLSPALPLCIFSLLLSLFVFSFSLSSPSLPLSLSSYTYFYSSLLINLW